MSDQSNPYQAPQAASEDAAVGSAEAVIRVSRTPAHSDRLRAYRILVDNVERGRLKVGESIDIPVDPGQHKLVAKVDWCSSPTITVDVSPGVATQVECASNLTGLKIFLGPLYVFLMPKQYLRIAEV